MPDTAGITSDTDGDLTASIAANERMQAELALLFGRETVDQAVQIDIVDLNLNSAITKSIAAGVRKLKDLKGDTKAQKKLIEEMGPGARLVLCMWIMDMELLDKIQNRPYAATPP